MENTNIGNANPLIQYIFYDGNEQITTEKGKVLAVNDNEGHLLKFKNIFRTKYTIGSVRLPTTLEEATQDIEVDSYLVSRGWLGKLILTSDPTIYNSESPQISTSRIKEIKEITNEQYTNLFSN